MVVVRITGSNKTVLFVEVEQQGFSYNLQDYFGVIKTSSNSAYPINFGVCKDTVLFQKELGPWN